MIYYIEVSEELRRAAADLHQERYVLFDRQFDNLWGGQGLRLLMSLQERLPPDVLQAATRFVRSDGEETTLAEISRIMDECNLIWK